MGRHASRKLANKELFPIGLGAMPLSIIGRPDQEISAQVITKFVESGGNFIDTADVYGLDDSDRGHNEKLIQQTLKKLNAQHVIVATKGGATRPQGGWGFTGGGHPQQLRAACEASLRNLKRETHSLYYLHGPDPLIPFADSLAELVKLKNEGKIENIGIANVNLNQLQQALALTTIAAVQNRCNPFCKDDLTNGVLELCVSQAILYVPYCPLGGWSEHQKLAADYDKNIKHNYYQICLQWLLSKAENILPIPGMDHPEQVTTNLNTLEIQYDEADVSMLDKFPNLYSAVHIDQ